MALPLPHVLRWEHCTRFWGQWNYPQTWGTRPTWEALKKGHHSGTLIETCLVRLPRLEGTAGHIELVGRLPLGETLGLQRAILIKARSAFKAIPA